MAVCIRPSTYSARLGDLATMPGIHPTMTAWHSSNARRSYPNCIGCSAMQEPGAGARSSCAARPASARPRWSTHSPTPPVNVLGCSGVFARRSSRRDHSARSTTSCMASTDRSVRSWSPARSTSTCSTGCWIRSARMIGRRWSSWRTCTGPITRRSISSASSHGGFRNFRPCCSRPIGTTKSAPSTLSPLSWARSLQAIRSISSSRCFRVQPWISSPARRVVPRSICIV